MSTADVFRTRQAVRDLTNVVQLHRDAVLSLGMTGADHELLSTIISNEGRIDDTARQTVYSSILLAASLPEDDFSCFIAATAILLSDRLHSGPSEDDLAGNWDAFSGHYRLADPPIRAAVMNGFRMAQSGGLVDLGVDGPQAADCLTLRQGDVLSTLTSIGPPDLAMAIRVNASAADAGTMWNQAAPQKLGWQSVAAFRYLYERPASIAPNDPETVPLIPWA